MNSEERKRRSELVSVLLLDEAKELGLREVRSVSEDPPDVEALLENKKIGIEVTEAVEEVEASTQPRLNQVVIPEIERLATPSVPGEVLLHGEGLVLPGTGREMLDLAGQIAVAVRALSSRAAALGSEVVAARGVHREVIEEASEHHFCFCPEIELPVGIGRVDFEPRAEGPLKVIYTGGIGRAIYGAGLETTARRIEDKVSRLASWPRRYDERWLLVTAFRFSLTSAMQAQLDPLRFPGTGFDQIWLIDCLRPLEHDDHEPRCNAIRLDLVV